VSEAIIHSGLQFKLTEHWQAYAEAVYTGNQYAANDNANVTGSIGGYTVYHFNLRYQLKSFSAAFHVNNIFNKNYYYYTVYQPMMGEFFYPAADRNVTLTATWHFN
jgi:iron complex outermembrane receptor protein